MRIGSAHRNALRDRRKIQPEPVGSFANHPSPSDKNQSKDPFASHATLSGGNIYIAFGLARPNGESGAVDEKYAKSDDWDGNGWLAGYMGTGYSKELSQLTECQLESMSSLQPKQLQFLYVSSFPPCHSMNPDDIGR
ncbi:hypothetical protein NP233_g8258 [Leucocoprinus birnbaumii]|uniref:Uncharacterized protein n=1 Tax=Leucocoprinus birnbaumii TaxID=56174 RepID=A0AAD5YS15_9AGAR|nr:hypothetical protein NP233_g8258 [Leucocoprinus birnbaumii]